MSPPSPLTLAAGRLKTDFPGNNHLHSVRQGNITVRSEHDPARPSLAPSEVLAARPTRCSPPGDAQYGPAAACTT